MAMIIMINLLILEDALPQRGSSLVLHIDGAAKHELDRLSEEDHSDSNQIRLWDLVRIRWISLEEHFWSLL